VINIKSNDLQLLQSILNKYIPNYPVWLFGSRCTSLIKPYSDIDLAIITETPVPLEQLASLEYALSESDLPYKVDLVDWSTLDDGFRQIIQNQHEVIHGDQ